MTKTTQEKKITKKAAKQKTTTRPELTTAIQELNQTIRHRTSRKYRFLVGIVTGLGTVIGATVLAGAIIYILSLVFAQIDFSEMPVIQGLIEQAHLSTKTPTH